MIDHISFGVIDFARSTAFYDLAFEPLRVKRLFNAPLQHSGGVNLTGYGEVRPCFWVAEEQPQLGCSTWLYGPKLEMKLMFHTTT